MQPKESFNQITFHTRILNEEKINARTFPIAIAALDPIFGPTIFTSVVLVIYYSMRDLIFLQKIQLLLLIN